jgi:hypothetical protein
MRLKTVGIALVATLMMSAAVTSAGPVGVQKAPLAAQQRASLYELEARKEQLSREMLKPGAKGPLWVSYSDRYTQLDNLIGRIQSGQSVSSDEIDAALQPVRR